MKCKFAIMIQKIKSNQNIGLQKVQEGAIKLLAKRWIKKVLEKAFWNSDDITYAIIFYFSLQYAILFVERFKSCFIGISLRIATSCPIKSRFGYIKLFPFFYINRKLNWYSLWVKHHIEMFWTTMFSRNIYMYVCILHNDIVTKFVG